jgi:aryl-alcohol dehydrogenase-like predicted oxidoreductase
MKYGIAGSGQMAATEVARVLRKAAEAGVELLDTAPAYGESESVIGKISLREPVGGVVTKVAVDAVSAADVRSSCLKSLERLRRTSLYGLLVHRTNSLLELNGCEIWKELEALKEEGKVERIGVSVYSPQEMSVLLDKFPLDMIQVPLSVLDQRMIRSNLLKKAKDMGVEIHARSVFLQGILLMDEHSIPKHLSGLIE